jgi:predicted phage terminase large subunit-like protein
MLPKRPDTLNYYITTDWALGEKDHNDYSVLLPFGVDAADNVWVLPSVVRIKATPEVVVERLLDLAVQLKPVQIGIESSHITKTIGPFLKRRMAERRIYTALWDGVPSKDKVARCASIRGRMQQGKVFIPDTPFFREVVYPELMQFPAGRHDDVVDCFAWAGIMLDTLMKARPADGPPPEQAPEWSMTWMKERIARSSGEKQSHIPLTITGRERKSKKVPTWNS